MIVPVGNRDTQTLTMVRRDEQGTSVSTLGDARFVPLIGEHGWR